MPSMVRTPQQEQQTTDSHTPATRGYLAHAVLGAVALTGIVAVALVAPNALQALSLLTPHGHRRKEYYPCHMMQVVERLKHRGLIGLVKKGSKGYYQITEKGREVLARFVLQEIKLPKLRKWDRKWRLLLFDIAESRKPTRENIRHSLERLGLIRLQDSVWVYPYPCEDIIELLRTSFRVRHDVLYLTTERFLGDRALLEDYHLMAYSDRI